MFALYAVDLAIYIYVCIFFFFPLSILVRFASVLLMTHKNIPGSPRMVKYGRHSVKPELCRTHEFHRPEYEYTAVTGLSNRSSVAHWSIPVAAIIPATPNKLSMKPITWQRVAAIVLSFLKRSHWIQKLTASLQHCGWVFEYDISRCEVKKDFASDPACLHTA